MFAAKHALLALPDEQRQRKSARCRGVRIALSVPVERSQQLSLLALKNPLHVVALTAHGRDILLQPPFVDYLRLRLDWFTVLGHWSRWALSVLGVVAEGFVLWHLACTIAAVLRGLRCEAVQLLRQEVVAPRGGGAPVNGTRAT